MYNIIIDILGAQLSWFRAPALQAGGHRFESYSSHSVFLIILIFSFPQFMDYFVYIIYSPSNKIHYIGHTNNLNDRILRHNTNRNKFTKGKGPWELVISCNCNSKVQAYKLELKLKAMKNPDKAIQYLKQLLQSIPTKSGGSQVRILQLPP